MTSKIAFCGVFLLSVLAACSQSALRFVEILDSRNLSAHVAFDSARREIELSESVLRAQPCSDGTIMAVRYSTTIPNFRIYIIFNKKNALVALQFMELGVSSFSPQADAMYLALVSRLRRKFDQIREHTSERDVPAFINRLNPQALPIC